MAFLIDSVHEIDISLRASSRVVTVKNRSLAVINLSVCGQNVGDILADRVVLRRPLRSRQVQIRQIPSAVSLQFREGINQKFYIQKILRRKICRSAKLEKESLFNAAV